VDAIASLAGKRSLRVAGLMSGTSADGVDVAVIDFHPRKPGQAGVKLLAFDTFAYPPSLRRAVLDAARPAARARDVCHLNFVLGEVFASAVIRLAKKARIRLGSIDLIGSHGQTVCHLPRGRPPAGLRAGRFGRRKVRSTLQIAEPSVIAERTGITTVADFRPRDVAAGGEGAPLVPYADWVLFRHRRLGRAVQNIGGIANVTFLPAGGGVDDVVAFDTGPGNMVIDRVVSLATRGRQRYDRHGALARRGKVSGPLLAELLRHPFLSRRPPKSTGREEFGSPFADSLYRRARLQAGGQARRKRIAPLDVVATVTAFTAASIAEAYARFLPGKVDEVILCGGGARNRTLVGMLRERVQPAKVMLTDDFGISADAKEAVSFAILAAETIRGAAGNVPSATGADRRVVLGKIVPAGQ
jgi:anhydro-N-acetylmuramic acid kinase